MRSFSTCHPATNFIFYMSAVIFGMIFLHPVFLCISFLTSTAYNIKLKGAKGLKMLFFLAVPLTLFTGIVNGLTSHYGITVLASLPDGNSLTLESIVYGVVTGLTASAVITWFSCLNETLTSDKILYLTAGKMPKTALIITMALRFAPLYLQKAKEIQQAQKGLGTGVTDGSIIGKIKNGGKIISVLISRALENGIETSDSMKARGYGLKPKTNYSNYVFTSYDAVIISLTLLCDAFVIAGAAKGVTYVLYNPFFKVNQLTAFSGAVFIFYGALCLIPLITDLGEDLKWKALK